MKNPKPEIRMTKEVRSTCDRTAPLGSRLASGFELRHSLVIGHWSLAIALVLLSSSFYLRAQSYSIDRFTIAGGGGASTGGAYSVSGTIGQPEAGPAMTNGQFSVVGGFWVLPQAVQVAGTPTLTITPAAPGFATISWTPNPPGFVLQETRSLSAVNWTNSPSGATNPVTLPAAGLKFFRLRKP